MALSYSHMMLFLYFCFFIFYLEIVTITCLPPSKSVSCHDDERSYLLEFMKSFNSSWTPEDDNLNCCSWIGVVECDEVSGHVISLTVRNELDGSIDSNSSLFRLAHLQSLDLYGSNFRYSEIPESITNLTSLESLRISSTNISGIIPSFLANLTQLHELDLSDNEFISQEFSSLSWISSMPKLSNLYLSKANLKGEIPMFIKNMTQLETLVINDNNLNGPSNFSALFGNLKNLEVLYLFNTRLSSLITQDSSSLILPSLKELILDSCELSIFPSFLRNLRNLTRLYLSSNDLSGEIPEWFMTISTESLLYLSLSNNSLTRFSAKYKHLPLPWSNLQVLNIRYNLFHGSLPIPPAHVDTYLVSNNQFSGEIPPYLSKLKLSTLDISSNNFTGKIPQHLVNVTSEIYVLDMKNNKFIGEIPEFWEMGCYMRAIDLSFNQLHGSIPKSLANCKSLYFFSFKRNNLTGYIPSWFGSLTGLKVIDISQNQLVGKLPKSLVNCSSLELLSLGNNLINDYFPSWLGHLPRLKILSLRSNKFHGLVEIADANSKFCQLQILDISTNNFVGELPWELFKYFDAMKVVNQSKEAFMDPMEISFYISFISVKITNKGNVLDYENVPNALVIVDCSSNRFGGKIPNVLGDLKGLRGLNLSNNILIGEIPSFLKRLSVLESLDLSKNNLSGKIPQELTLLDKLGFLDMSYNQLSGPIPKGRHFDTLVNNSIIGNVGLCGEPLLNKCTNETSESPDQEFKSSVGIPWSIVMMGFGTGTIIGLSLGYIFTVWKHELFVKIAEKIFLF